MPKIGSERRNSRRRQIMEAAGRGLRRKSYGDLTVDEICVEAGLSKGAFYVHFPSKQSLLVALVDEEAVALDALIDSLDESGRAAILKIRALLRELLERGADPARVQVRADMLGTMLTDEQVHEHLVSSLRKARLKLKRWIDDAVAGGEIAPVPANALAAMILALADGLTLHYASDPTAFRWANIRRAVDAILDGLAAEAEPPRRATYP